MGHPIDSTICTFVVPFADLLSILTQKTTPATKRRKVRRLFRHLLYGDFKIGVDYFSRGCL